MDSNSLQVIGKRFMHLIRRKSPEILTGVGIGGMIATTVLAVKATPEAMKKIEEAKKEGNHKELTAAQTVEAAWKCYIPAGITGTISIGCLIGSCVLNGHRTAALATAAGIAETSLMEYRSKVVEAVGEKKEAVIREAVDRERVEKDPPPSDLRQPPAVDGLAPQWLCYDALFGRYFYSNIETLKNVALKLNRQMTTMFEPYISLNDFYIEIGLPPVDIGGELGWNVDHGLIELSFSSHPTDNGTPCLVMSHLIPPTYNFDK